MSDVRPPSRPPPSKGAVHDEPAPIPPSRAEAPEASAARPVGGRRRRWWLAGIATVVAIAAIGIGAALLLPSDGDDDERRIQAQYGIVNREVDALQGAGVCTVRDVLAQRVEGTPHRFTSDVGWEPIEVFDFVWSAKRLAEQMHDEWRLQFARSVPELTQLEDRWTSAWLAVEADGYHLDDESTRTLVELSEDTLALTRSAGLDVC